jgi:hypothetical protein
MHPTWSPSLKIKSMLTTRGTSTLSYGDDAVILDGFGAVIAEGRDGIRAVYERVFTNNPCRGPNGFQHWQLGRDSFDSAELGDAGRPQVANAVDRRLSGE